MQPFFNMETKCAFGKDNVVRKGGELWVGACFTGSRENQDILSGQTQHPRELIGYDWVRICGVHVKQECRLMVLWRVFLMKNTVITVCFT